jgi:hypothetical protein
MRTTIARAAFCAAIIVASGVACAVDWPGERPSSADRGESEHVVSGAQKATSSYCVLNPHTDKGTVHFEGPDWLLASAEGASPMMIELRVLKFILPATSTTGNYKPDASTVSNAIGYSITERYGVEEFSRVTVATARFQRVEAYPAFQRTIYEIRDADCNVLLGAGAAYKPIGVYFKVVTTTDVALPDVGVRVVESLDDGSIFVVPGGPAADAGPGDAGARRDGSSE